MNCEMYILEDGSYQCGNCGHVHAGPVETCQRCGSSVAGVVDEGEADDSQWEDGSLAQCERMEQVDGTAGR